MLLSLARTGQRLIRSVLDRELKIYGIRLPLPLRFWLEELKLSIRR
jgi:hypothetical protein